MIYVTGDLHGDIERFRSKEMKKLKSGDTLIVCGDFGFVWDDSKKEQAILKKLGKKKYQILFLEGTHDNLDLIEQYPLEDWGGGKVRRISGSLLKLERGNVFEIEGKKIFAFGGGESQEQELREEDGNWWKQELPDRAEMFAAKETLAKYDHQVDYIVTHDCSPKVIHFIGIEQDKCDQLSQFFEEIGEKTIFKQWFFGCYHIDKRIPPKYTAVFEQVIPLE